MAPKTQGPEEPIEIEESEILTDSDWATLNEIRQHHGSDKRALQRAFEELAIKNPECYVQLLAAFDPTRTREALLDSIAEQGLDQDDIREIIRSAESPSKKSH